MKISARESDGILVVRFSGEIRSEDNRDIEALFDELEIETYKGIVVDLRELEYVNSRAIGSLMALWKRAASESIRVVCTQPNSLVARLLTAVGLYRLLPVYEDVDGALKALAD